ncbi:hypothetical protein [Soonwooa sp.]|uniref:hypothetical protein n=1 Tax=Soonwooa sp. TaxID=1938592 RepID=UPI0028AD36B6|nr:hypothetical protein [Soonwooa sp.]
MRYRLTSVQDKAFMFIRVVTSSKNLKDFVSRSFNDKKIHLFSIQFSLKTTQTDVNFLIPNSG